MALGLGIGLGLPFGGAGGGAAPVVFLSENRVSNPTLTANPTFAGDSLMHGVGAPTNYDMRTLMATLATFTPTNRTVSGMAWNTTVNANNTDPIPTQISGQGATPLANNFQIWDGGLNDYLTSPAVVTVADAEVWPSFVLAGVLSGKTSLTGGASQYWCYFTGTPTFHEQAGMFRYASWTKLKRDAEALYGASIYDLRRGLMFKGSQEFTDANLIDVENMTNWADIPLSYRGHGGGTVQQAALTAQTDWVVVNTATNTSAGVGAAVAALPGGDTYAQGTLCQNTNSSLIISFSNFWRKVADSTWQSVDGKHMSRWGYAAWARISADIGAALSGLGAPVGCPAELFCKQDAAAGAACGTIYYVGSAPATLALFTTAGAAVTTLTLTDAGSTNNRGSITVTRSGSGALTEGEQNLVLQLTDSSGRVLHSPVDFRVGQPSTQTTPRLWNIPNTSDSSSLSDFSGVGRDDHGMANSGQMYIAGWVKPQSLADTGYLIDFTVPSGRTGVGSYIYCRISTTGQLAFVADDTAGTLVLNSAIANVFAAGQETWFCVDIDFTGANTTIKGLYAKNGAANAAINVTGLATGTKSVSLSTVLPRFWALRDASSAALNYSTADTARDQFRGAFGNLIFGYGGLLGLTGAADATSNNIVANLWGASGVPAARTPYAAINGQTPFYDIQGGIGDFLRGGMNINEPVFHTYRGIKGLTV